MVSNFISYSLLILTIIANLSCRTNPSVSISQDKDDALKNDTAEVLSLMLNKDFLGRNMLGYGGLGKPSPFGDTIIFKSDSIITRYLPENINGFHFKFLTQDQICQLASFYHTDTTYFPDFFELKRFQKRDSIYDIALQVSCVMPLYDKNGNRIFKSDAFNDDYKNYKCIFGVLCGGGMSVTAFRVNDTLRIKKESSWSD
jgi:hypothetical protein